MCGEEREVGSRLSSVTLVGGTMTNEPASASKRERPVTAEEALRIAGEYEMEHRFKDAKVTDSVPESVYGVRDGDYWAVYPRGCSPGFSLGGSTVICVDKNTGKLVFAGRVGESTGSQIRRGRARIMTKE
jgi:hypothetical protein